MRLVIHVQNERDIWISLCEIDMFKNEFLFHFSNMQYLDTVSFEKK